MSTPLPNNGPDNFYPGGPPMVRIDGAAVRRIREEKGLTQLYVATVVQVTTDTISRWENRRYPSIKKENAEKLAEALGVELAVLLEQEEPQGVAAPSPAPEPAAPPAEAEPTRPARPPRANPARPLVPWLAALFLLLALALALLLRHYSGANREPLPAVTATRILPAHVPPGQEFPVLLRVAAQPPASFALIIRESLPPGCRFTIANPATTGPGREGQIKWVSRLEGGERLFAYRLTSPVAAVSGTELHFQGQVVVGSRGETISVVSGAERMAIAPYHWADLDGDHRIDDEEILWVYEVFGALEGFDALRDEVDNIWTAGGYRWDGKAHRYLLPQ